MQAPAPVFLSPAPSPLLPLFLPMPRLHGAPQSSAVSLFPRQCWAGVFQRTLGSKNNSEENTHRVHPLMVGTHPQEEWLWALLYPMGMEAGALGALAIWIQNLELSRGSGAEEPDHDRRLCRSATCSDNFVSDIISPGLVIQSS